MAGRVAASCGRGTTARSAGTAITGVSCVCGRNAKQEEGDKMRDKMRGESVAEYYNRIMPDEVSQARRILSEPEFVDYTQILREDVVPEIPGLSDVAREVAERAPWSPHQALWGRLIPEAMPNEERALAPRQPSSYGEQPEAKSSVYRRSDIIGVLASLDEGELQVVGKCLRGFMGSEIFDHIVSGVHDKAKQDKVATWQAYGGKSAEHGKRYDTEYVGTFMGDFSAKAEAEDDS